MRERFRLVMGQLLLIGLLISLLLTAVGGGLYLYRHGNEVTNYQVFQKETHPVTSRKIWKDALTLSPYGIIQLGILILVLTQLLRVALVAAYYFRIFDHKFMFLSLFILGVLIYSLFWDV